MRKLADHFFNFSPSETCGESLTLSTIFYDNGDGPKHPVINQELRLQSYGNSASFSLCGITLTPAILRKLANELEKVQKKLK
jgi:hypothetical protein